MSNKINTQQIMYVLYMVVFIDIGSNLMLVPVLPSLLNELLGANVASSSRWFGWMVGIYAGVQFICAPYIGKLSDKYGRRYVLLACSLLFMLDYIIAALATNAWVLFIGRLLAGIPGASIVTVSAIVADITAPEKRVKAFSSIYAVVGISFIMGPLLGGIIGSFGVRLPFWFAVIFCLLNALLIFKLIPETKQEAAQNTAKTSMLADLLKIGRYPGFLPLFIGNFITLFAFQAPIVLWPFYTEYKFNFSIGYIGISLGVFGLLYGLVNKFLVPLAYAKLGLLKSIYLGFIFFIIGFIGLGLATNLYIAALFLIIYSLGAIASSPGTSLFTLNVAPDEQGKLQGILSSLNSLASIIAPIVMSNLFYWAIRTHFILGAGTPFILGALMLVGGLYLYYTGAKKLTNVS